MGRAASGSLGELEIENDQRMSHPGAGSTPCVYVVDDDQGVRISISALLSAAGIQVKSFADPDYLLDHWEELPPGVILLDIQMPGHDGLDLLTELRARDCHWPTAVITAHGAIPLAVRAMKLGAIEFLEKPFTQAQLEAAIAEGMIGLPAAADKSVAYRRARQLSHALTPRQRQIFDGVADGLSNKEIARNLGISHRTVEAYRMDMMNRLGLQNLMEIMELKPILAEIEQAEH